MDLKKTGALIAAIRKEKGLTQEQLDRGFRFVGEDCTVTALRDGYLGLFTVWSVYDYPNS